VLAYNCCELTSELAVASFLKGAAQVCIHVLCILCVFLMYLEVCMHIENTSILQERRHTFHAKLNCASRISQFYMCVFVFLIRLAHG